MRLTLRTNRWTQAAMLAAWVFSSGCQRLPYIDQSKTVPHDPIGATALEDKEVKQADFLSSSLTMQMPKVHKPRTTNDPEAEEVWQMTLQEAIRIGLDNSEIVRVIPFGAQGIPIGGFEPSPLNTGSGAGAAGQLGAGSLQSVYDPAFYETLIPQALSVFDTAFTTSLTWGKNTQPYNNAIQGGSLSVTGPRTVVLSTQDTANFAIGLQKNTATGGQIGIVHNVNWLYQNSTFLTYPSVYTTNIQMSLTQPLMGSAPLPGQAAGRPVGLEANRAPIVIARLNADAAVWRFKAEVMAHVRSIEQQYWSLAQQHVQLWSSEKAVELAREIVNREQAELVVGKGTVADVAEAQQRLEQFNLDLVTKTSDVITTERQLRNILGLPPADNRRIIPVTPPAEARLEPDWDSSLAQMVTFQPDIVQQQLLVRIAELQLLVARNQLLPQLNLSVLYQLNGLGQQLDNAEAVMTGATIKALEPVVRAKEQAAGLLSNAGYYNNFHTWQVGFTFQMPLGMRSPLANTRQRPVHLAAATRLPATVRSPDDSFAGPVLPGSGRQLQAIQDGVPAPRRGRPATGSPACLLRGRPDHDRPVPRRGQPVCPGRGPGSPVQDDLQHLDRRSRGSQGYVAGLQQHRRGRGPASAQGLCPGPRHPGRTPQAADSSRRSDVSPASHGPAQSRPRPGQPAAGRATG